MNTEFFWRLLLWVTIGVVSGGLGILIWALVK